MITTQTSEKQTGAFSRIQHPFVPLAPGSVLARVRAGKQPEPPLRNMLAGPEPTSIFGRILAWLRGEI